MLRRLTCLRVRMTVWLNAHHVGAYLDGDRTIREGRVCLVNERIEVPHSRLPLPLGKERIVLCLGHGYDLLHNYLRFKTAANTA